MGRCSKPEEFGSSLTMQSMKFLVSTNLFDNSLSDVRIISEAICEVTSEECVL